MTVTSFVAVSLVALYATPALAQGVVTGHLTDPSGGQLPGAVVTAESAAVPEGRRTFTDEEGEYEFTDLPPGRYTLTFAIPGFTASRVEVELAADEPQTVDAVLDLGSVDIPLTFTGPAPFGTAHFRLAPAGPGIIQLCEPAPSDVVGPCRPVIAAPQSPN